MNPVHNVTRALALVLPLATLWATQAHATRTCMNGAPEVCDPNGSPICTASTAGSTYFYTCDTAAGGDSVAAEAWAVYNATDDTLDVYGTDNTGMDFCCKGQTSETVLSLTLQGSETYGDTLSFSDLPYASELGAISGHVVYGDLRGGGGNDVLTGSDETSGSYQEVLYGDAGNDTLTSGFGDDLLYGGAGNDTCNGEGGDDVIYGGGDNDTLYGEAGDDIIEGGAGNDTLEGGNGGDILRGDAGVDYLYGGDGPDYLRGDDDGDFLWGDAGDDTMCGGAGGDELYGGDDDDRLWGGVTSSSIPEGGAGDNLDGQAGSNTCDSGSFMTAGCTLSYSIPSFCL